MRPALAISLVAALGIHAAVLLVPRVAAREEAAEPPSVTIEVSQAPVLAMTAGPVPAPPVSRPSSPPAPVSTGPIAEPEPSRESPQVPRSATASQDAAAAGSTAEDEGVAALSPAGSAAASAPVSGGDGATEAAVAPGGGGGHGQTNAVQPATVSFPVPSVPIQPAYPRAARLSGRQGVVKVVAMVDQNGSVTDAELSQSSGSALLDRAALDAVRRAVFVPARKDGKTFACSVIVPIRFQLSGASR